MIIIKIMIIIIIMKMILFFMKVTLSKTIFNFSCGFQVVMTFQATGLNRPSKVLSPH